MTGREVKVLGVDGFTIDRNDHLIAGCWAQGHLAVVDTKSMQIIEYIDMPCRIPTSCGFAGKDMDTLIVTTADYGSDIERDPNAGFTVLVNREIGGRKPFVFG